MASSNTGDAFVNNSAAIPQQSKQSSASPDNGSSHEHHEKKGSRAKGSGTDFVKKLFQMLEENTFGSIVHWSESGDSFIIADTNEFTKQVLPSYFKHSNFASFVRQLNKYDFHKVKFSHDVKQRFKLDNVWEFKHPQFSRHNKAALNSIKRKAPVKREVENGILLTSRSSFVSINQFRTLQDRLDFIERDNRTLRDGLQKCESQLTSLHGKYNSLVATLLTSRTINESFAGAISTLAKALSQMGVQLPPLNLPFAPSLAPSRSPTSSGSPVAPQSNQPARKRQRRSSRRGPQQPIHKADEPMPLPLAPLSPKRRQQRLLARPKGSSLHVLLVEDDDVCVQLCKKFLVKYGCTVVVVKDGLAAISAVEKVKFDLVLMDIVMPNLDGASATAVIRSFDSDTPIIAMTGNYQKEDLMTYLSHGMTDILAKPFTKLDLYMILEKHQMGGKLKNADGNGVGPVDIGGKHTAAGNSIINTHSVNAANTGVSAGISLQQASPQSAVPSNELNAAQTANGNIGGARPGNVQTAQADMLLNVPSTEALIPDRLVNEASSGGKNVKVSEEDLLPTSLMSGIDSTGVPIMDNTLGPGKPDLYQPHSKPSNYM